MILAISAFQLRSKIDKKASPDRSKINQNFGQHLDPIFDASWKPTWLPRPSQNPPKIDQKSMKNGYQNQSKFCMHFEWPFGGSWGQHGRKSLPKGWPGGWWFSSRFRAWKGLGRVLGPLGASWGPGAEFNRFLIDFWWILVDFWWIFGWFFNDFW